MKPKPTYQELEKELKTESIALKTLQILIYRAYTQLINMETQSILTHISQAQTALKTGKKRLKKAVFYLSKMLNISVLNALIQN